jgi:hypothetical protein
MLKRKVSKEDRRIGRIGRIGSRDGRIERILWRKIL